MLIAVTGKSPRHFHGTRRGWSFSQLGAAANRYHLPLMLTTPSRFHPSQNNCSGWLYDADSDDGWKWTGISLDQPLVIYDAMYLNDLKEEQIPYRRFRKSVESMGMSVFNPVLPAKDKVYRALESSLLEIGSLPNTKYHVTFRDVMELLEVTPQLWLKPVFGSGGKNILYIHKRSSSRYRVIGERFFGERVHRDVSPQTLWSMLHAAMRRRQYMAQEHVSLLEDKDGRRVDFRITVQRNEVGDWRTTAITARTGAAGSILTNYHAGGSIRSLTILAEENLEWLRELGMQPAQLRTARRFALSVARGLQRKYPTLAMLGLDLGRSTDDKWYVYDCNGRPGRDILTDAEVEKFMNSVAGYARYVLVQKRDGG